MKKLMISLVIASAAVFPGQALAAAPEGNPLIPVCNPGNNSGTKGNKTDICKEVNNQTIVDEEGQSTNPIVRIIKAATKVVAYVAGAMSIIFIILASFRFITSNGDSGSMAQARQALIYALVGIVIVVMAQVIVVFVLEKL